MRVKRNREAERDIAYVLKALDSMDEPGRRYGVTATNAH